MKVMSKSCSLKVFMAGGRDWAGDGVGAVAKSRSRDRAERDHMAVS
jgi:hypothetical protein